jgi:hypothetical protein
MAAAPKGASSPWPEVTQSAKPWTRWWWPGNAVEPVELTRELEAFAKAGLGGVEITPIYGARGAETRIIEYLSPRWVQMLAHVTREARRLGLGVDMSTGTGWPFGGPRVSSDNGSSSIEFVDGRLTGKPTGMKVKRAAPGSEGLVLDPYSTDALDRYLQPFTRALAPLRGEIRSQFHDSFEYYDASWSPGLPERFRQMHGYDLGQYAAGLVGEKPLDADTLGRITGDYRRTLATMHLDYVRRWADWAHARGSMVRNQAHGAPGRLLDLYAAVDIPETESFGATELPVPGLRLAPEDSRDDPDPPINLIGRFASSAAHVLGRPLASSETLTWLRENFRESPSQAKPQLDRLFVAGINHLFYHGSTYSPDDLPWPGWFFYAATQLNPRNPLWRDFGAMHAYVARVQSVLQAGRPDNDILVYWPEADEQDQPAAQPGELMRQHGMHENDWLVNAPAGQRALQLLQAGYSLDFVSDEQLAQLRASEQGVTTAAGQRYRLILVPRMRRMPLATLRALAALAGKGATVAFERLPEDVPGFGKLGERRAEFQRLREDPAFRSKVRQWDDPVASLEALGARRESMADMGLWYVRRAREDGTDYFVVNLSDHAVDGWVTLATRAARVTLLDPLTGSAGVGTSERRSSRTRVYLQIDAGQSLILRTDAGGTDLAPWPYSRPGGTALDLTGPWRLRFTEGGPELPEPADLSTLSSWTRLDDPDAVRFSGTARYIIEFDVPGVEAADWLLDLGDVRETARVTLNGRVLGTVWSLPARIHAGRAVKPGRNVLEIEVTNLPANRIRDLDLRKADWKIMKDINLASLRYGAFDAAGWQPQPSGLLGPVRLVPLHALVPAP